MGLRVCRVVVMAMVGLAGTRIDGMVGTVTDISRALTVTGFYGRGRRKYGSFEHGMVDYEVKRCSA